MSRNRKILIVVFILLFLLTILTTINVTSEKGKIINSINFIYEFQKKCGFYPPSDVFDSFYTANYKYTGNTFEVEPRYFRGYDNLPTEFILEYETSKWNLIGIGSCSKKRSILFGGYQYECFIDQNNIKNYYKPDNKINEEFLICKD